MRRVMVLVVDSFHPKVLKGLLEKGKAPALGYLAKHGILSSAASTFPTMTPTASATIATGYHCDQHHVPGFIWYDEKKSYYVNYGASLAALLTYGPVKAFSDLFYSLNDSQLNKNISTVYEDLHKMGIASACINFFIRRAGKVYSPKFHWLMNFFRTMGLKKQDIKGPDTLVWGEVISPGGEQNQSLPQGMFNKFGVNDKYTSQIVSHLIRIKKLPAFSLVYFPDNDRYSHVHGPLNTQLSIEKVDAGIGEILSAFGSWERALRECHFIVIGDHAQSQVQRNGILRLDKILAKYKLSPQRFSFGNKNQMVVSANERMASININDETIEIQEVIDRLGAEKQLGLIMWKDATGYNILSEDNKLTFKRNGEFEDSHGLKWEFAGDLTTVGAKVEGSKICFHDYPDAFERISAALDYGSTRKILLSAPVGFEYYMPGAPVHPGGGSHGSLHFEDSIVPVISAGRGEIFSNKRTLDIKKHIIDFFEKHSR